MPPRTHHQASGPSIELATELAANDSGGAARGRPYSGPSSRVLTITSYLILVLGVGTMAAAAYLMLATYTTVPFWDEWIIINGYIGSNSPLPLQWMWAQHNEHRIVFQKLLVLLDLHFFKGREWPMFVAIFLSQLGLFRLLAFLLRKIGKLEGWAYRSALGIALYCVFCPSQWENYTWGFQLSLVFVNLLFTSALAALLVLAESRSLPRQKQRILLAVSILAAAAATICNANGLIAWPILIAASVALRLRWPVPATYALAGAGFAGLYFHGYVSPSNHASPLASLHQPLQIIEYVEKYFGNSFVPSTHLDWSLQLGAVGLTLACASSFWMVRKLPSRDRTFSIGLLALMGYLFLTACVTALGRINFGTDQALSPRYQSYALLFWFSFAILVMTFLMARQRTRTLEVLSLVIVALFATSALWFKPVLEVARDRKSQRELAGTALLTGVHDDDLLKSTIFPSSSMVWNAAAYFRQHRLSIFSTPQARGLDQPLTDIYKLAPDGRCLGFIDRVQSFKETSGGVRLEGWAVDGKSKRPLSGAVMVNDGLISGYGVPGFQRSDVADSLHSQRAQFSGWIGFVEPGAKGNTTEVYGVLDTFGHRKVCKIGQAPSPGT